MPSIQQLVRAASEEGVNEFFEIAQKLQSGNAIAACIAVLCSYYNQLLNDEKEAYITMIADALRDSGQIEFIDVKCAQCGNTVVDVEKCMKDEVNLCPKCGHY